VGNETNPPRELQVSAPLYEASQRLIAGTRFQTVDEFVAFVLQQLTSTDSAPFDEQERRAIEERLRDLGYL
jgi:hypothetical protein